MEQSQSSHQNGIDIHKALSILSDRANPDNDGGSDSKHSHENCCHGSKAPENAKEMGQTIDLMGSGSAEKVAISEEERQKEELRIKEERAKRREEILKQLNSMKVGDLLRAVLTAQQDRVATYKDYER